MKKRVNAQASLEYAVVVGLIIVATVPLFYYAHERYVRDVALTAVDDAVNLLVANADAAYLGGPGTTRLAWVTLPGGIVSTDVSGRHISVKFHVGGRETEINGLSQANLTGSLPSSSGTYLMRVQMQDTAVSIART